MRLLKINLLIGVILSVSACYYDFTYRCLVLPQSVYCPKDTRTDMEILDKNVSYKQKLQDFQNCGATPDKHGNVTTILLKKAKEDGLDDEYLYVRNFYKCMIDKNYLYLSK